VRRVALVLACALLGGCPWGTMSSDELEAAYPYANGRLFSRGVLAGVVKNLEQRLGSPLVSTGISVSPESVVFLVRDPKHPERIDSWPPPRGPFVPPAPGPPPPRGNPGCPHVPHPGIPNRTRPAPPGGGLKELKIEAGRVEYVSVNRRTNAPEFAVSVTGPRQKGRARFSATGEFIAAEVD